MNIASRACWLNPRFSTTRKVVVAGAVVTRAAYEVMWDPRAEGPQFASPRETPRGWPSAVAVLAQCVCRPWFMLYYRPWVLAIRDLGASVDARDLSTRRNVCGGPGRRAMSARARSARRRVAPDSVRQFGEPPLWSMWVSYAGLGLGLKL